MSSPYRKIPGISPPLFLEEKTGIVFLMRKIYPKNRLETYLLILVLVVVNLIFTSPLSKALDLTKIKVLSSQNISTNINGGVYEVYLNTFLPNTKIFFKVQLNNLETTTLVSDGSNLQFSPNATFQFSVISGATLDQTAIHTPIKVFNDSSGSEILKVFPAPSDFPITTFSGETNLVTDKQILSTPVVTTGTYALATKGNLIQFFTYSPNNLIGFRKLDDSQVEPAVGGQPYYAYLEQSDFGVSATSPGIWRLLDKNFSQVERINSVRTPFGLGFSEGHGITTSPQGNSVVITTPTRSVDSSWLNRQFKLPILDCDISEIHNGISIRNFSLWDWALLNKKLAKPIFDVMPLFNDPQNPTSSPIDICHANSLEYYKPLNVYLLSLRSPSILVILDSNLKNVLSILKTNGALQHFARFVNKSQITDLGNYTFAPNSKFQVFNKQGNIWKLSEYDFPAHVEYCGNTNFLDKTHVWLGGGCGPTSPGILGSIYQIQGSKLVEIGKVKMSNFTYSYRADLR
jgi:hypothetical protein